VVFEFEVAAILMGRLLRGRSVPVGMHEPVVRVAFQQSNEGYPLDDVVAHGPATSLGIAPSIQIQVKRGVKATAGDTEFIKVLAAAAAACGERAEDPPPSGYLLGLAARRRDSDHLDELRELTDIARAHERSETFQNQFRAGITGKPIRDRLDEVSAAVATASGTQGVMAVRQITHQILRTLHVWSVEEGPDGRDWRAELDGLTELAADAGKSPADIMAHLYAIAGRFGPRSGNVDADHVRRELARLGVYLSSGDVGVRRQAESRVTIHASGESTVFHGQVMNFGTLNIHGKTSTPGKESKES
jgi:hypothetical protein